MLQKLRNLPPYLPAALSSLIAAFGLLKAAAYGWRMLPHVVGWEAEDIALSLLGGHGFSFPGHHRWLWPKWHASPNEYFATAWQDPGFTYILAGAHWLFGEHAFLAIFAMNGLCLVGVYYLVYRLSSRFAGPWAGTIGVALITLSTSYYTSFFSAINNTALASFMLCLMMLTAVRYFEHDSWKRLVTMGVVIGLTLLTCPAAQYVSYGIAVAVAFHRLPRWREPVLQAASLLLIAALVISPWTIRNYLVFHEYVPIRNGAGQLAYVSTVAAAETFMPGAAKTTAPPPWHSSSPQQAVLTLLHKTPRIALNRYEVEALMASPPPGYETMNEAQRDKVYLSRTKEFVRAYPVIAAKMAYVKLDVYIRKFYTIGLVIVILAVVGGLLALRDPRSWPISLTAGGYSAPFVLVLSYYDRYRAPVEPAFIVLAAAALGLLASYVLDRSHRGKAARSDEARHTDPLLQRN